MLINITSVVILFVFWFIFVYIALTTAQLYHVTHCWLNVIKIAIIIIIIIIIIYLFI